MALSLVRNSNLQKTVVTRYSMWILQDSLQRFHQNNGYKK